MKQHSPSTSILRRAAAGSALTVAVVLGATTLSQLGSGAGTDDPAPASPTTTTTSAPASGDRLFGEIRGAYVAPAEIAFDEMELVAGDEGGGAQSVRNPALDVATLPVSDTVEVTVVDCSERSCSEGTPIDYGSFTRRVADDTVGPFFWITVRDGSVVRIDEKYVP